MSSLLKKEDPDFHDGSTGRAVVQVRGAVQGTGFRPFVYNLAQRYALTGFVVNTPWGLRIDAEGNGFRLKEFLSALTKEKPPQARITGVEVSYRDPAGYHRFDIRESEEAGVKSALILPDIAVCQDCLSEIFDPSDRRFQYPFTNCTHCGPRFTIIERLPYDRANTSMKNFTMCPECREEYENPSDRRFHAQPNCCQQCGPQLELWDHTGTVLASAGSALEKASEVIQMGGIVAVKGIGGFHLMADACNPQAVSTLRQRKKREEKPFALMFRSLNEVERYAEVSEEEALILGSSEAPIVLLRKKAESPDKPLASEVAPGIPYLGAMLACTPLHHLLLSQVKGPLIATSGNLSDEVIATDEQEALKRLGSIADYFLIHNRPIVRHCDDSIVRIMAGREAVLRRARGFAPIPIPFKDANVVLAAGGHMKNTVAMTHDDHLFVSQYIGDLETESCLNAFASALTLFEGLYGKSAPVIACDMHAGYASTNYALKSGKAVHQVQHHVAHVVSCMAENELRGPVLGVSFDGSGWGPDGTIWGGEFIGIDENGSARRVGSMRAFQLPGGEKAVREPRRAAAGLLYEEYGESLFARGGTAYHFLSQWFSGGERDILKNVLQKRVNSPLTSSVGRIFDAISAICGLCETMSYEGQAAMLLEAALNHTPSLLSYPFKIIKSGDGRFIADWGLTLRAVVQDRTTHVPIGLISAKFHNTIAEMIAQLAEAVKIERVVLSGGCFQNRYLLETVIQRLRARSITPYWHQRIPPNDGGISVGQAAAVALNIRLEK